MNQRLRKAFAREKDFECLFLLPRFAKRELCWKFESRNSHDFREEECCLYPQHEHISRVSFLVCLSVFACTPVHSNSPTTSTDSLGCMFRRRLDQTAFRTHLSSKNMCSAPDPDT